MTATNLHLLYLSRIESTLGAENEVLNKRLTMNLQAIQVVVEIDPYAEKVMR